MPDIKFGYGDEVTKRFDQECPFVVVCEGKDDQRFIKEYLKYLSRQGCIDCKMYKIIKADGVDNIKKDMKNFKLYENYDEMKGFLFISDADKDGNAAADSFIDHIGRNWDVKLSREKNMGKDSLGVNIGFYIFPGKDTSDNYLNGALEDLCVNLLCIEEGTLGLSSLRSSIDSFMDEIVRKRDAPFKSEHKNRLYLFLSSTDKAVGKKIGQAAKVGAFDFSSPKLAQLKKLILQMQE